jgi:selenide,water dikinase
MSTEYKLTQYSHGYGCGCKIGPEALETILHCGEQQTLDFKSLLVGNSTRDDAAVYDLDGETAIISTTDFFTPIVDEAFDFGAIAATNAISDIYAMGGTPLMAVAILGWPVDKLPAELAGKVLEGGRKVCSDAGIPLAGGHSIDSPEPIFGLAVTGKVSSKSIKKNTDARPGDLIYLTKPIGVGMITTAQKMGHAEPEHLAAARATMLQLNSLGAELSAFDGVNAITDVTGFGLAGHLLEVCEGSACSAELYYDKIPRFDFLDKYLKLNTVPTGSYSNWKSYGSKLKMGAGQDFRILTDPQTSGGLLITVAKENQVEFEDLTRSSGMELEVIGEMTSETQEIGLIIT